MATPNHPDIANKPAAGISYFTPAQIPPAGSAAIPQSDGENPPKLFQPFKVRDVTFHNRIGVSSSNTAHFQYLNAKSLTDVYNSFLHYVNTALMMAT